MGNPVVYFEVGSAQPERLVKFYEQLFGWAMQPAPGGRYTSVDTRAGSGVNGGIGMSGTGEPWSTFYVEADDLQALLDKAESLGAKIVVPVTELPAVTYAMFDDPDGLLVGLLESSPRGVQLEPSAGDGTAVDWFEVLGSDAERTQSFYTELFGWKPNSSGFPGYSLTDTGAGRGIGGGLGAGGLGAGDDSRWATIYATVPDVEQALAKAEQLGGTRVYGPDAVDDHMQTGAFRDPAGNLFGIYSHQAH